MSDRFKDEPQKKYWTAEEALPNMQRYCAYQERCHSEVRNKLLEHGIYGLLLENIIAELITENFLNEERFACSYARGKFRIKQWGKRKIVSELKQRQISDYCIQSALNEIEETAYLQTLKDVLSKKDRISKFRSPAERKQKLTAYAITKGFEYDLIQSFFL